MPFLYKNKTKIWKLKEFKIKFWNSYYCTLSLNRTGGCILLFGVSTFGVSEQAGNDDVHLKSLEISGSWLGNEGLSSGVSSFEAFAFWGVVMVQVDFTSSETADSSDHNLLGFRWTLLQQKAASSKKLIIESWTMFSNKSTRCLLPRTCLYTQVLEFSILLNLLQLSHDETSDFSDFHVVSGLYF